jgi:acetyl-CoA synthetase
MNYPRFQAKYSAQHMEILRNEGQKDVAAFWAQQARHYLQWDQPFHKTLEGHFQSQGPLSWFADGQLNASVNCLDRHLLQGRGSKVAYIYESEDRQTQKITYQMLSDKVHGLAQLYLEWGLQKGDRVLFYAPSSPDVIAAILACTRIGCVHSVVFAGLSPQSLAHRIQDCEPRLIVTAQGLQRQGKVIELLHLVNEAIDLLPETFFYDTLNIAYFYQLSEEKRDTLPPITKNSKIEHLYQIDTLLHHFAVVPHVPALPLYAEDPLFILYTSGSTGKPKGLLHTHGGYLTQVAATFDWVFQCGDNDIYWCTADIGWITGHSYVLYAPLMLGVTSLLYDGGPSYPDWGHLWSLIERHGVTHFYTAPTLIRSFMAQGDQIPQRYNLQSLKLLGSVGEPINPAAWDWFNRIVGLQQCPIVDTWWQTETGAMMMTPLPTDINPPPGYAYLPLPGISMGIMNQDGVLSSTEKEGPLVITHPWPSQARSLYHDFPRFRSTYYSTYPGYYFSGDGVLKNADGHFKLCGRIDDVLNVSGHRLGTAEIESALVKHDWISEAAVVSGPDPIKGEHICCFVRPVEHLTQWIMTNPPEILSLKKELEDVVTQEIGKLARPDVIVFVKDLPKTRSGKIMRRLLKQMTHGQKNAWGDLSTLSSPEILFHVEERFLQVQSLRLK